jgi:hypothetical protein
LEGGKQMSNLIEEKKQLNRVLIKELRGDLKDEEWTNYKKYARKRVRQINSSLKGTGEEND